MADIGKIAAVIAAGGASRRLGAFKPLVQLCGRPLISYSIEFARSFASKVCILVRDEEQYRRISRLLRGGSYEVICDSEPGSLPASVAGAIRKAGKDRVFVLGCDMPFLDRRLPAILNRCLEGTPAGAAVPAWPNGFIEPFAGVYLPSRVPRSSNLSSMRHLCEAMGAMHIDVFSKGIAERTFINVNSHSDLEEAERLVQASLLTST
uniref:MobA-like NTP transferase domain-containing protein n=1 Tax=Candidatus Methanomethylicus mesodigestus TaxID=1867258 RepID=A0A7C3J438_9CREN